MKTSSGPTTDDRVLPYTGVLSLCIVPFLVDASLRRGDAAKAAATLEKLEARIEELERELAALRTTPVEQGQQKQDADRLDALERKAALDRLNISGEIRVAGDTLNGTQAAHFDGMMLQKAVVDSMFFMQTNGGAFPLPQAAGAGYVEMILGIAAGQRPASRVGAHRPGVVMTRYLDQTLLRREPSGLAPLRTDR